jgi:hypothetical protein
MGPGDRKATWLAGTDGLPIRGATVQFSGSGTLAPASVEQSASRNRAESNFFIFVDLQSSVVSPSMPSLRVEDFEIPPMSLLSEAGMSSSYPLSHRLHYWLAQC